MRVAAASYRRRIAGAAVALGCVAAGCAGTGSTRQPQAGGSDLARPPAATAPLPPLRSRVRPDVLVVARRGLAPDLVLRLRRLGTGGHHVLRAGTVTLAGRRVVALAVDPAVFRRFTPKGTAESTPVWEAVARGEAVVAHDLAKARRLPLGDAVSVRGRVPLSLRLGALATTGLPDVALVVNDAVGATLGLAEASGAVLSSGNGDPATLAAGVRRIVGDGARIDLLTQPAAPYAFLTGGSAAKAFGAFSYRYHPDGTIEPDARWVATNIVTTRVPMLGVVTCHRLMVPQLRNALAEIERAGLGRTIRPGQYGGCYVPRFIERNPSRPVSLHTWGIAVDLNVPTNLPGTRGDIDPRVVAAFKKWGFRWGGDWSPSDPMHFELGALLRS